jgi:uncharacterized membrane protein YphA (DoxX/SURF4 family)
MSTNKLTRTIFWITTVIIFLFEGVMPALTGHTELAKEGIRHLGYPAYFGPMLAFFKILGTLALILPFVPDRIKEWAYFGLGISMVCACISHIAVDGFSGLAFFPLIIFAILSISYVCYHKLQIRNNLSFA